MTNNTSTKFTVANYAVTFDPAMAMFGEHELTSDYVETFYLPLIGPSATMMLRAFGWIYTPIAGITATPTTNVPIDVFAQSLGLAGRATGEPTRRFRDVLARLERPYRLIERTGPDSLTVAALVPTLTPGRIAKLPAHLQHLHSQHLDSQSLHSTALAAV